MGFKENLKMLRKSKGVTQEEFGKLINKSKLTIIRYENGETFPSFETLKEICNFFNIEIADIVMNIKYEKKKYTFDEILKLLYSKKHELAHIKIDFNKLSTEKESNENKNIFNSVNSPISQEIHNQLWALATEKNKNQYDDYILEKIKEEVKKYDFSKLFENKTDIKSFINDFSLMLRYDLIENHNNISHDDRLKILKDLKKYYEFLINDYKKTQK